MKFVDILNAILAFQLSVFLFFLMRRKSRRATGYWQQPNRLLSLFLLVQLLIVFNFECFHLQEFFLGISPHFFFLGTPFYFLAAPAFYFYVRSLAFSDFRVRAADILHALPFVAACIFFSWSFLFLPADEKRMLLVRGGIFPDGFWIVYNLLFFIQFSVYFVIDLRILRYYREQIKEQFSSIAHINLSWLTFILYGFILAWLSSVASLISTRVFSLAYDQIPPMDFLAFFCFLNYIFYKGLSQPEIFSGVVERPRYETSRLTTSEGKSYLSKLETHMLDQKPYLNPMLTLKELALQVSLSPRYLSQIVNEYAHQNFYDFVNRYRIEEAKRLLSDRSAGLNVTEILYEVGFNSKSSFNTAFKQLTGVSPSQFKKRIAAHETAASPGV